MELQTEPRELETPEAAPPPWLGLRLGRRAAWVGGLLALAVAGYLLAGVFTVAADEQAVIRRFGSLAESVLTETVLGMPVDEVLTTGRLAIQEHVKTRTQEILDRYDSGVQITSANMMGITLDSAVAQAFQDVANASADRENKINQGRSYANDLLPKARGEARSIVLAAQSYREQRVAEAIGNTTRFLELLAEYNKAPEVTRTRLYLEAMEKVLPKVKKYVIDSEHGRKPINLRLGPTPP